MDLVGEIASHVFSLYGLFLVFTGVTVGVLGGALPGISTVMTVALVSTATFTMEPLFAVLLLLSTQVGSTYGGSITATVLNIPGTPANAATVLEAYPLMKKGQGPLALSINVISSFMGNTLGAIMLLITMPFIVMIAMNFLSYEMFWFSLFGVVICAQLSKGDFVKGLIAGTVGIILGTVGIDPIHGAIRLNLGFGFLNAGISLIPAMVGLFGISEILNSIANDSIAPEKIYKDKLFYWKEWWPHKWLALRVTLLGFLIGVLPGVGANVAAWIGYDHAKSTSKNKEEFGTGRIEGLIGCETATNAAAPGGVAPLLALGIPGDGNTAIVLGILLIHGVQPGPTFIANNPAWLYSIVITFLLAGVMFLFIGTFLGKWIIKCISIPLPATMAVVTLLCIIGSFAYANRMSDVYLMFVFGIVGYLMSKTGFPVAPLILGLILSGGMIDPFFRRGLLAARGDFTVFLTRPISAALVALLLFVIYRGFVAPILNERKQKKNAAQ